MEGALLVSVGLPDITNNVVIDAVENVVTSGGHRYAGQTDIRMYREDHVWAGG